MADRVDPGRRVLEELRRGHRMKGSKRPGAAPRKSGPGPTGKAPFHWTILLSGFVLGVFTWLCAIDLGASQFPKLGFAFWLPGTGVLFALLSLTRLRAALWAVATSLCLIYLVIGYTPIVVPWVQGIVRRDRLEPADAVVVLSSGVRENGDMDDAFQFRVLHGYEILRQKLAPRLLVTRLAPTDQKKSYIPAIREQMRQLDFAYPVEEVGPVWNTHDEALAVSKLVHARGWKRVILVSDPTHLRRAGATFEKAGVRVFCSPCRSQHYDINAMKLFGDRINGFREWIHEVIGYQVYHRNGWL